MEKAIICARVSSKEQDETGYSLDAQEKLLSEYANHKGLAVAKIFRITESASGKQIRKTFNEMMQYAEKNRINTILCEKIDRLTRNMKDAVLISDWIMDDEARQIHFVKENFVVNRNTRAHENLVWDMKVAIARFYTNNLSEEVRKGQKEKIAQGWLPTKPPVGYRTIGDKGHKTHVIDEAKAPFIKRMFELYSTGNYSTITLSNLLYTDGLRSRVGKQIGKSRMYDMLRDPFYYGAMRWKGEVTSAKHEPLISKELFDRVQGLLNRSLNQPQFNKHLPVFKAKMSCAKCGGSVTWETHKGHWYGHCNGYMRAGMTEKCEGKRIFLRQDRVEEAMFPFFEKVAPRNSRVMEILAESLKDTHAEESSRFRTKLTELNQTIERSQRRLETVYEDKLDGKISAEVYEGLSKRYQEEKELATAEISRLNKGNKQYYEAGYAIHELASKAAEIYQSKEATNEDRRALLSYVFSNIEINGKETDFIYSKAFDFLANWVPKLNLILELENSVENKRQNGTFVPSHPVLLRG
jgi:DNA invertase Pin-like site-specific DNA recombinase